MASIWRKKIKNRVKIDEVMVHEVKKCATTFDIYLTSFYRNQISIQKITRVHISSVIHKDEQEK